MNTAQRNLYDPKKKFDINGGLKQKAAAHGRRKPLSSEPKTDDVAFSTASRIVHADKLRRT